MLSRPTFGVDTGGTFTDFASVDPATGRIEITKVPSTPDDPSEAIRNLLMSRDGTFARVVHGTTVATNTVLERKGARIALITTLGFRDTLEIGRTRRDAPGLFNTKFIKQPPLIPRSHRFEVDERLWADGSVMRALDETDLSLVIDQLKAIGPEVVVVCLLHSYANPVHERRVREAVRVAIPHCPVVLSSEVVPEFREFERLSTAVINGYTVPCMASYLNRLVDHVTSHGGDEVHIMGSNGGVMTAATAATFPVRTILSGPAGGIRGAMLSAEVARIDSFLTCDMGGTSTDVALVRDLQPEMVQDSQIASLPLKVPQLDIHTVGAGGGSIAWIDFDGSLRVGPQSAGAVPGPACYGRGGIAATVTDANLHLGRLVPDSLIGGALKIDRDLSRAALESLARQAGIADIDRLAHGIIELVVANMVGALREISIERGHDPRDFTLLAFGGAGPLHAAEIARAMRISKVVVPRHPGNLSAVGLLGSDIRYDLARTFLADLASVAADEIHEAFAEIEERGAALLRADGFAQADTLAARSIDMRFQGQAFALSIPVEESLRDTAKLRAAFTAAYTKRYGHGRTGHPIEIVAVRLTATGIVPRTSMPKAVPAGQAAPLKGRRPVYLEGQWRHDCAIYDRERIGVGQSVAGPAVIEEFGSTTVVPADWSVVVDEWGNLRMELDQANG